MNFEFLKLYESLNFLYENLENSERDTSVEVKGNLYNFVTDFMTRSAVESLYNSPLLKSSGIYIFKYEPNVTSPTNEVPHYYIGKATKLQDRIKAHFLMRDRDSVALHAAIKAHGKDAFKVAIIEVFTQEEGAPDKLAKAERYWIEECRTFKNHNDYNLTPGGDGGASVRKVTLDMYNEIRKKLNDLTRSIADIANEYNLQHKTIRDINNGTHYWCKVTGDGPARSSEQAKEIGRTSLQKANSRGAVIAYKDEEHTDPYKEFPSRTAAAKEVGGNHQLITRALGMDPSRPEDGGKRALGYY